MVTSLYAGILVLIFIVLSIQVVVMRMRTQTPFGDRGDSLIVQTVRIHGNFAEYVPFALLLLALYELQAGSIYIVHALGLTLVVARLAHIIGLKWDILIGRALGTSLTMIVLGVLGVLLLLKGMTAVQVL